jgi:peptidoglycan-N-acetylmuramic acid deacetylase
LKKIISKNISVLAVFTLLLFTLGSCGSTDKAVSSGSAESGTELSEQPPAVDAAVQPEKAVSSAEAAQPTTTAKAVTLDDISSLNNEKKGYGQGKEVDSANRPTGATMLQSKYGKYDAIFIAPAEKNICLTFDEGYENGYTAKILDVLKQKECSAVFFVTMDYVKRNPELIKRMIDEGHVVGNHTVHHPSMPTITIEKAKNEIQELHDYVEKEFGYKMTLFRPPMGEYSERTLAITQKLGYKTIFWSFAYEDWKTDNQPDKATALKKIKSCTHDGAIYLLHAVSSTNTAILGDAIDYWRSEGYKVSGELG